MNIVRQFFILIMMRSDPKGRIWGEGDIFLGTQEKNITLPSYLPLLLLQPIHYFFLMIVFQKKKFICIHGIQMCILPELEFSVGPSEEKFQFWDYILVDYKIYTSHGFSSLKGSIWCINRDALIFCFRWYWEWIFRYSNEWQKTLIVNLKLLKDIKW